MSNLIKLPTTKTVAKDSSPNFLLIYGKPKCGKTSTTSQIPENLIIDIEDGSDYAEGFKVKVNTLEELQDVLSQLVEYKEKNGKYQFRRITLDTATRLEDMILPLAARLYRATPMGKNWDGDDVKKLPQGAGYLYLRDAYMMVLRSFKAACEELILIAHLKDKLIDKQGEELSSKDIDLTGKLARLVAAEADAVGYVYRKGTQTIINFEAGEDIVVGSRLPHLSGQKVVIADSASGELVIDWSKIFID